MRAAVGVAFAALLMGALRALAQAPPVEEQKRPAEGIRETQRAGRAAEAAGRLRPLEPGETVRYEDVLEKPDDVALNYLYAQSQVVTGELRGAASTLERILLVSPDIPRVRLLYGVVLFRLDNPAEAERELNAVSRLPMPASLREEVDAYLEQIALRRKATRRTVSLSLGPQWDSNRNAGPRSGEVLFFDTPFDLLTGRKQGDFSGVGLASFDLRHDLGYDAGHTLDAAAQVYGQKQADVTDLDLMALSGEAGGLYRAPGLELRPRVFASYLNLAGESYVTTAGAGLRASRRLSARLEVAGHARADYEFFEALTRSPITDERTGFRIATGLSGAWSPRPWLRFDVGASFLDKQAREDFFAYRGPLVSVGSTWLLGRGQFLLSTFSYEYDGYAGPDRPVSSRTRRDQWYRGRIGYGAPLGFLLQVLSPPRAVRDTLLTANVDYLNVQSNITNYQYDNWRLSLLFTKSFDF